MQESALSLDAVTPDPSTVHVAQTTDAAEWDRFVATQADASPAHRYAWRQVIERAFRHQTHYLRASDDSGRTLGVLPAVRVRTRLFGDYLVSVPYLNYGGLLAATPAAAQKLQQAAIDLAGLLGVSHFEFRDTVERAEFGDRVRTDKVVMELQLPDSFEALQKSIGAKVRSQARRPVREGASVVSGGLELLDEFYSVFSRNMRDLGTPVYARSFFAQVLEAFPADARIHVVRVGSVPAAAGFLLGYRDRLEIPWASSLREFNRIGVNMYLYQEVLRHAIESGYKVFDFGRSTIDKGTYRFKAQWGAVPRQLYWHYWLPPGQALPRLNPDNPKYRLAIRVWQKLPLALTERLGPPIVRGLP